MISLFFTTLLFFGYIGISQDTLIMLTPSDLYQNVSYAFMDLSGGLCSTIREDVDSIFHTYDFSGKEYDCQYFLSFLIELDSCGRITSCKPSEKSNYPSKVSEFGQEVQSLITASNCTLQNTVQIGDSVIDYHATLFAIEISCDPDEVLFPYYIDPVNTRILAYRDEYEVLIFSGFQNRCE